MAGHVYGWLIFNQCANKNPLPKQGATHNKTRSNMDKTKKKRGRPRKDPATKVKSYYVYLKPDQAQGLKKEHGSLTRAIKKLVLE